MTDAPGIKNLLINVETFMNHDGQNDSVQYHEFLKELISYVDVD